MPGGVGMGQSLELPGLGPHGNFAARGLVMPGGVGMGQSLELRGLGPHGKSELEAW